MCEKVPKENTKEAIFSRLPKAVSQKLQKEYQDKIPEKIQRVSQLIEECKKTMSQQAVDALRLEVHKIAGSAATYGYPFVSTLCQAFEKELVEKSQGSLHPSLAWLAAFEDYLKTLKEAFGHDDHSC